MMQNETTIYMERLPLAFLVNSKIISRPQLYKLRAMGKIKFHYLLTTPFISMPELYAAMTAEPEGEQKKVL
jgi:hypothetical protein